jgi:hypothetical protein
LTRGFFDAPLLDAPRDLKDVIAYVQRTRHLSDTFCEGQWRSLDLEELFTALEAEREFHFDLDTYRVPTVDLKSQLVACR